MHPFPASCRAIDCIGHCSQKLASTVFTCFCAFLSSKQDWIAFFFSSKLVSARIRTKLSSFKKVLCFFATVLANSFNFLSIFPRFSRIYTLFFSSFRRFKPLSGFSKLFPPLIKIKSSFGPMPFKMFRSIKHFKVCNLVIVLVAIFMMNIHAFRNCSISINPNPSLRMNGHIIHPVSIFLFPKGFSKILSFLNFTHRQAFVSQWLVSLSRECVFSQAISYHPLNEASLR